MNVEEKIFTYLIYHNQYLKVDNDEDVRKKYNVFENKPFTRKIDKYTFKFILYSILDYFNIGDKIGFVYLDERLKQDGIPDEIINDFNSQNVMKYGNEKPLNLDDSIIDNLESFISNISISDIKDKNKFIHILLDKYKDLYKYKIEYIKYDEYDIFIISRDEKIQRILINNKRTLFIILTTDSKQILVYQYIYQGIDKITDDDHKILENILNKFIQFKERKISYFDIPLFLFQENYQKNIKTDLFVILYFIFNQTQKDKPFIFGSDYLNRKLEKLYTDKQFSHLEILINLIYLYKF